MSAKRVAIYLRVSTNEQTTDNQEHILREVSERRGWTLAKVYNDTGISGSKARDKRPGLNTMLQDATRGRFDIVMAFSVDRLGRSLADLVATMQELKSASVDLYLHTQALDTSTPSGRAFFGMLGVFAEFEREMIVTRVKAGMARAKREGKRIGRPKATIEIRQQIRASLQAGLSINATAKTLGVGNSLVSRVKGNIVA